MYYVLDTHYSAKVFNRAQPPFNSFLVPSLTIPPLFGIRYIILSPAPPHPIPTYALLFMSISLHRSKKNATELSCNVAVCPVVNIDRYLDF